MTTPRAPRRRFLDLNGLLWREQKLRSKYNLCAACLAVLAPHASAFCHSLLTARARIWLCRDCGELARDAGRPVPRLALAPAESEAGHA